MKSKIPYTSVDTDRGQRYQGSSKMNFQNLVLHGLSSISIYLDVVSIRLLFASIFAIIATILGLAVVIGLTLFTDLAIPGWPSIVALSLLNILAIVLLTTFLILLFQLNQKNTIKLSPRQFYKDFILSVNTFEV
jgi:protein-S-isoprenylcysteine O-methyltransferase Ste14